MKKALIRIVTCFILSATLLAFSACSGGCNVVDLLGGYTYYTISYEDDGKTYHITIESGEAFSLESIPEKEGYDFLGLFDSETGGTQCVSANGDSIVTFSDEPSSFITLYPQFAPKKYKVILNYEGAENDSVKELTAFYDSQLPTLPNDLTLSHYIFEGWFTKPNCEGIKVAGRNGLDPLSSIVNSYNFDLSTSTIELYAGFSIEQFTVTFNFGNDLPEEKINVGYNTHISQVVPDTRNNNGQAVLTWSTTEESINIFDSYITSNITLYAVEWAPVIELDVNGGNYIAPIVLEEGSKISLPTPTRDNFRFMGWVNSNGNTTDITAMPEEGLKLKATWQPLIQLDSNGGSAVEDICETEGTSISLPEPTRNGYMFAGWFTEDREPYYTSSMPKVGIKLKAGWCVPKKGSIAILSTDDYVRCTSTELKFDTSLTIDLKGYLPEDFNGYIDISVKWKVTHEANSTDMSTIVAFYSRNQLSNQYFLASKSTSVDSNDYTNVSLKMHAQLHTNAIYVATASDMTGNLMLGTRYYGRVADMSVEFTYPDMTTLYV